jgi:hypothetical protein
VFRSRTVTGAIPFLMISDQDLLLATALRLPTFGAAGVDRLKRLTLIVDWHQRTIVQARYPGQRPVGAVTDALAVLATAAQRVLAQLSAGITSAASRSSCSASSASGLRRTSSAPASATARMPATHVSGGPARMCSDQPPRP